ncbi:MAG TPA: lipopolysaccharide biosynthesis protein [Bacillota bacterium]|nr:lipopolysaccharide biosynthesis protein [Bacillota bacterium]
MLDTSSVKYRLVVSVIFNFLRSIFSFLGGMLIARGLNPTGYGELTFLLGSFVALRSLVDMGSSSAFFTFISKRPRDIRYFLAYLGWLALQFTAVTLLLWVLLPEALVHSVWLGHPRSTLLLAFGAAFLQQQLWPVIGQLGEAARKTIRVQIINLTLAILHLGVIGLLLLWGLLSTGNVLWLLILEYGIAGVAAYYLIGEKPFSSDDSEDFSFRVMLKEYWDYCKPLIFLSIISFLYDFADKWMLQKFGGAHQQGFFQISSQFANVSLLITASILNVFWKEIAAANENRDSHRISYLYHRVSRGLFFFSAALSGFLIPWSKEIVQIFLGQSYIDAWPVLALMLLYPIHQSLGQILGIMFLASGETSTYMRVGVIMMVVSVPVTYLLQAPGSGMLVSGFALGAMGMALKTLGLNILSVNLQAWILSRNQKWKHYWTYQILVVCSTVAVGFLVKQSLLVFFNESGLTSVIKLVTVLLAAAVMYFPLAALLVWSMPMAIGMDRLELKMMVKRMWQIAHRG